MSFETTAGKDSFGVVFSVLQKKEERWKNKALKSQARVHIALESIPLSTFEI